MSWYYWKPYETLAAKKKRSEKKLNALRKKGVDFSPVVIEGRKIAKTFWGGSWCKHLESFSDYENRLPRGRSYVRGGLVCHLAIEEGSISAAVTGSEVYSVCISVEKLDKKKWGRLKKKCSGQIGSILELVQGKLSGSVMEVVTDRSEGLFPLPGEISFSCDCPDWASMCKHVSAALYGAGARLDENPELLFLLRGVDHGELISADIRITEKTGGKRMEESELAGVFGIEIDYGGAGGRRKKKRPRKTAVTPVHGGDVVRLRKRFKMTKKSFASLLGVTPASVSNWEKKRGALNLRPASEKAFRDAKKLTFKKARARV